MTETFLEDLTFVVPEKKVFRIGTSANPVEVDLSIFPARAMFKMMEIMGTGNKIPSHDQLIDVVVEACHPLNPEITKDWLLDNSNFAQLSVFCERVMLYGRKQVDDFNREYRARYPGNFTEKKESDTKN